MRNLIAGLAALTLVSIPVAARQPSGDVAAENDRAEALGRQIYLHDQAAWHGTDALAEEVDVSKHQELRGYVVDPLDNGNLGLVFYAKDDGGHYEFARYEVDGSTVVGGGRHVGEERIRLSPILERLVAAKGTAIGEAVKRKWGLCTTYSPNFVMLPPDDEGMIAVYLLTSTQEEGVFPFGGHYRVEVDAEGRVQDARKFTNNCLNMRVKKGPNGENPFALGVSHVLDEHPTELHYFQSNYVPIQVFVIIDGDAWVIDKGEFRKITDLQDN